MSATDSLFGLTDPVLGARTNGNGHVVITKPSRMPRMGWLSTDAVLLSAACVLLAALAAAMGIVSWHAQYAFIFAAKHQHAASALEAFGLDAGAVIFSVLGIALARLGRRAIIERALVLACALGSCAMNLLGAELGSPRSVVVYVMPPLLFAAGSDRLIAVIRRSALGRREDEEGQRSAWVAAGHALLYLLRFLLAPPSTASGVRRMVLNAAPLPSAAAVPAAQPAKAISASARGPRAAKRADGGGKQARLIELAGKRHDLATLPLADVSRAATDLAAEAELHPGTARRVLLAHVRSLQSANGSIS
ncbi:MAG TPA: hypothetical protein VF933_26650 [Streptosporangiaceae bacterium]